MSGIEPAGRAQARPDRPEANRATFSGHLVYPERESPITPRSLVRARGGLVTSAHPLATRAGLDVLAEGGSAADAAIACAFALSVVEPQSSGLGGGGYALVHDPLSGAWGCDGRERAPAATTSDLFEAQGAPLEPAQAATSGRSIGTPSLVPMLWSLHAAHGRLPWARLVEPAIALADDGFEMSERLRLLVEAAAPHLTCPVMRAVFLSRDGGAGLSGRTVRMGDLADVLRRVARQGPPALATGEIAEEIVRAARGAPHGSPMETGDLARSEAEPARLVEGRYRSHRVLGLGGSTAGGVSILQMLSLLERFDLAGLDPDSLAAAHLVSEVGARAFADRFAYLGDTPAGQDVLGPLLDAGYLAGRSAGISLERSGAPAAPGLFGPAASGPVVDGPSTTHLSVVDSRGQAAAITQSIGLSFGAAVAPCGIILNNQLVAFSPDGENAPGPGKRPLSSMAPTIVLRPDGGLRLVTGSPGSSAIVGYVLKSILGVLDWRLDIQRAVDLPNIVNRNGPVELERGTPAARLGPDLERMGHRTIEVPLTSGLHAIEVQRDGELHGAADPRRDGLAAGIGGGVP